MNTFSFTGNLGRDCRVGTGSTPVVGFGVGVKSGWGDKAQTIWIDCSLWGKQVESCIFEYLLKGQQIAVTNKLGTHEHEGKTYLTCRVSSVDLIGGKRDEGQAPQARQAPRSQQAAPPDFDDDLDGIPFAKPHWLTLS